MILRACPIDVPSAFGGAARLCWPQPASMIWAGPVSTARVPFPPQFQPALSQPQGACPLRHSFNRLWVVPIKVHSLWAACNPRLINRRQPCPSFTCPNTGSTVMPLSRYVRRPLRVSSLRSIRSRGLRSMGMSPRGHPLSRAALRCFQPLVVAISNSGPSGQVQSVILASLQ